MHEQSTTCVLIMGILLIEKISAIYARIHGFKKNSSCTKRGLCKLVSVEVLIFYLGDSKLCFRSKLNILKENYFISTSKFANIGLSKKIFYDKNHLNLCKIFEPYINQLCDFIMNFLANPHFILQISHAKTFKKKYQVPIK